MGMCFGEADWLRFFETRWIEEGNEEEEHEDEYYDGREEGHTQ